MPDQNENGLLEIIRDKAPAWTMPVPANITDWLHDFVMWMVHNFLSGGVTVVGVIFFVFFFTEAHFLTDENVFATMFSMLVLGISVLAVHVDFDRTAQKYYQKTIWYLGRAPFVLVPVGVVLAVSMIPSVRTGGGFFSNLSISSVEYITVVCGVFFVCVTVSYAAYLVKMLSKNKSMEAFLREVGDDYKKQKDKQEQMMKSKAAETNEVDGLKV